MTMTPQDEALGPLAVGLIVMILWTLITGFADWYKNGSTGPTSTYTHLPAPTRHRLPWRT